MGKSIAMTLFVMALLGVSCAEVEMDKSDNLLNGVWVNSVTKTDTLDFSVRPSFSKATNLFQLKRGTEVRKGQTMPKIGNGYYEYIIAGEKILLKGVLIDIHSDKEYVFKLNPDSKSLQIGSFAPFEGGLSKNEFIRID